MLRIRKLQTSNNNNDHNDGHDDTTNISARIHKHTMRIKKIWKKKKKKNK